MTTFTAPNGLNQFSLPSTFKQTTPVATSFHLETSTFGGSPLLHGQLDFPGEVFASPPPVVEFVPATVARGRNTALSPEALAMLDAGIHDAQEGRVSPVPIELLASDDED